MDYAVDETIKTNEEEMGLTLYRLGIAHGQMKNFKQAKSLVEKSLTTYRSGGKRTENHPYVRSALCELAEIEQSCSRQTIQRDRNRDQL